MVSSYPNQALLTPAKTPTSPALLILRIACLSLHSQPNPSLSLSSSILFTKLILAEPFPRALRASSLQISVYPDPIPDFVEAVFNNFLHNEYGGPGTLLVEPFTDMFVALKEKKLPGASMAARTALLWAQNNVDHDWEIWNS